jgi:D-serine deaminase-like pyridoxal phosphate-dependent protein
VELAPGNVALTFNLHDIVWVVRDRKVVDILPIAARGRSS